MKPIQGPAFPRTRDEKPPHWTIQAALGALIAGCLVAACFL